jgi:hypothetical protein
VDLQTEAINWPTAHALGGPNGATASEIGQAASNWPTAQASDGHKMSHPRREGDHTLTADACLFPMEPELPKPLAWATAQAADCGAKCTNNPAAGRNMLMKEVQRFPDSPPPETITPDGCAYSKLIQLLCRLFGVESEAEFRAVPKSLNPRFVEFLMGWELDWTVAAPTDCAVVEMASSNSRPHGRSHSFSGDCAA